MQFWDLLYRRYSDPVTLLNQMIQAGCLDGFIDQLLQIRLAEREETTSWQFYLHRAFDQSYEEFRSSIKQPEPSDVESYNDQYVETTIQKSKGILKKFKGFS